MRIVFLTHYDDLYGANRSLLALLDGLESRIEPIVALPGLSSPMIDQLKQRKIPYLQSPVPLQFVSQNKRPPWWKPRSRYHWHQTCLKRVSSLTNNASQTLCDLLSSSKPDLIYTNSTATRVGSELARKLNLPHVWHLRELPDFYDLDFVSGIQEFRSIARLSQAKIAISQFVGRELLGPNYQTICSVVENAVATSTELDSWSEKIRQVDSSEVFRFIFLGHLTPNKGLEDAIGAISILKRLNVSQRFELHIFGSGSVEVEVLTRKHNVQELVVVNAPTNAPIEELLRSHCLLMCSRREGWGRVTAEAMACGVPVIGYRSGGTIELIQDGLNGLLYLNGSRELSRKMLDLMSDQSMRINLIKNGLAHAKKHFSTERYSSQIFKILSDITRLAK